jgi:four helix bundle protein
MRFIALERALEVVRSLRAPLEVVRRRDAKLFDEMRRAANSVCLNLAEGSRRRGADRLHFWRIAAGSAAELRAALHLAEAWGDLDPTTVAHSDALLDQVLAILWRLTR